jgi:hypothetical protein
MEQRRKRLSHGIMSRKKVDKKHLTPLTQTELVTWAVYLLGGAQKRVDTEDVAIKAFALAPKRFSWHKYPEQINLELVRVYLSAAKDIEHGELIVGSGRTGWSLTRKGLTWVRSAEPGLQARHSAASGKQSKAGSIDANRQARERKRILSMPAWARWATGDRSVAVDEAREVFRIDSYSTASVREAKMTRMRAMFSEDEQISAFLAGLSQAIG